MAKTERIEEARSKENKHATLAQGYRSRIETWLVVGNGAGLALTVSGFASGKLSQDMQPAAAWSAWLFFVGMISAFMFQLRMGTIEEEMQNYYAALSKSIGAERPEPKLPKEWDILASLWVYLTTLGFGFGVAVPLLKISMMLFSGGRLPVSGP